MPTANESTERIVVERIAPGGDGIAHLSTGELVFVASAAPGDEIEIGSVTRSKGIAHATIGRLLKPGSTRVAPPCLRAEQCGGCDFMHLSLGAQRDAKLAILRDALRRVGDNPHAGTPIGYVESAATLGYRSRVRLHTTDAGNVGFFAGKSKDVVTIDSCPVSSPRINAALSALATAGDTERKRLSFCKQIELREAETEPYLIARLTPKPKAQLAAARYAPMFPPGTQVLAADDTNADQAPQRYRVHDSIEMLAPATAFTQVNLPVNQKLVAAVVEATARYGVRTFLDAYAGAGNFTLPLLACGLTGEALDVNASGIYAARNVARDRGLPFNGFQVGDARKLIEAFVRSKRQFDLVLLDPPREGSKDVLEITLKLRPKLILLVACDPVALARDLKTLVAMEGHVDTLTIFDMFPHTHHFETLAVVEMPLE